MFNTLLLVMSLLVGIFILAWRRRPALRQEIEKPKYRFLTQERRFDAAMSRSRESRTRIVQDSTTKPPSKLNHSGGLHLRKD